MRDLIYMTTLNNPMKSKGTVVTRPHLKRPARNESVSLDEERDVADGDSTTADKEQDAGPVPQVKLGPDGSIIIDERSLVVHEPVTSPPTDLEEVDETNLIPGFASRKKSRSKTWSLKETKKFYVALNMIGTDFSLMSRLFPKRDRGDLKRKFKREEKMRRDLVESTLKERRKLDISLLAEPLSSDEEAAVKKKRKKSKVGRKKNEKENCSDEINSGKEAENISPPAKINEEKKQTGPARRNKKVKKKSLYYDDSTSEEELIDENRSQQKQTAEQLNDDQNKSTASTESAHVSDDDEATALSHMYETQTRYGRKPKPLQRPGDALEAASVRPRTKKSSGMVATSKKVYIPAVSTGDVHHEGQLVFVASTPPENSSGEQRPQVIHVFLVTSPTSLPHVLRKTGNSGQAASSAPSTLTQPSGVTSPSSIARVNSDTASVSNSSAAVTGAFSSWSTGKSLLSGSSIPISQLKGIRPLNPSSASFSTPGVAGMPVTPPRFHSLASRSVKRSRRVIPNTNGSSDVDPSQNPASHQLGAALSAASTSLHSHHLNSNQSDMLSPRGSDNNDANRNMTPGCPDSSTSAAGSDNIVANRKFSPGRSGRPLTATGSCTDKVTQSEGATSFNGSPTTTTTS